MSKNNTLADTAVSLVSSTKDENFKDIIRYKAIAALLVKLTIPEFKDKTLVEIAKLIVDLRRRNEKDTATSILEDEVDFLPTEAGTNDEKNTLSDSIFQIRTSDGVSNIRLGNLFDKITVNAEMQNTTSESVLGYNLISRAVYYGASLLRSTVPSGDTKYTDIHKVYSIWFCNGNIKFDTNYDKTGSLSTNQSVEVTGYTDVASGKWYQLSNGSFVSSKYLSTDKVAVQAPTTNNSTSSSGTSQPAQSSEEQTASPSGSGDGSGSSRGNRSGSTLDDASEFSGRGNLQ